MTNGRVKIKMRGITPIQPKNTLNKKNAKKKLPSYKLKDVLEARQIIGEAYEQATNVHDNYDKLIILKEAYKLAIQDVPDNLPRPKRLYLRTVSDYQNYLNQNRIANLLSDNINKKLDQKLQHCQSQLSDFQRSTIAKGVEYQDDIVLLDRNYEIQYPSLKEFSSYIQVYKMFLQHAYEQLRKPLDPKKYLNN